MKYFNVLLLSFLQLFGFLNASLFSHYPNDPNAVCRITVSYTATRMVPYIETYRSSKWGIFYETKYRWNSRKEFYIAYRTEDKCCEDYEEEDNFCVPICNPPCKNGECISPGVCKCFYGYIYDAFNYCEPFCEDCVNGKCIEPNICACNEGYSMDNISNSCRPVCKQDCEKENALCTEPDTCTCNEGYQSTAKSDNRTNLCEPICDRPCINGNCVAPDVCECNEGYSKNPDDPFTCLPKCDKTCIFGKCTAPNKCTCDDGYKPKSDNICEPICNVPCQMGTCIAPDICSCNLGYGFTKNSKYICEPICELGCINGTCTSPDVCTCHEGHRPIDDKDSRHICKPHCETPCGPFGECTAPETCTCFKGYRRIDKNSTELNKLPITIDAPYCAPICTEDCINGYCSAPQTCGCYPGFRLSQKNPNTCEPVCTKNCGPNETCVEPDRCECNKGYTYIAQNATHYTCVTYCDALCGNNTDCIAPGVCTCKKDYEPIYIFNFSSSKRFDCKPICKKVCVNGYCGKSGLCECNINYYYAGQNDTASFCNPHCAKSCGSHGQCISPNHCECNEGYRPAMEQKQETFICEPVCDVSCGNGTCTLPNVCTCDEGYENDSTGTCVPLCRSCQNGYCELPDVCECNQGYTLDEENVGNDTICVPFCENCMNGECIAPGDCKCHFGFEKNDSDVYASCIDICENKYVDEQCIGENKTCECKYGWTGENCDEPLFCIVDLDVETAEVNLVNVTSMANETAFVCALSKSPKCGYKCVDEIRNYTLCFEMDNVEDDGNFSVICLISTDTSCYLAQEEYRVQNVGDIVGIIGAIAIVALPSAVAVYLFLRKRRIMHTSLGDTPSSSSQRNSLLEEDNNNL